MLKNDTNKYYIQLVDNLKSIGPLSDKLIRISRKPFPRWVRKLILIGKWLIGKPYFYKRGKLPSATVYRTVTFNDHSWIIECDLESGIDRHVAVYGMWEPHLINLYKKYIYQGSMVLDIGANIGIHSLVFSTLVGDSGKVYSFEPAPQLSKRIKRHSILNRQNNINIVPKAASDVDNEEATFFFPKGSNKGLGSLEKNYDLKDSEQIVVRTVLIDNLSDLFDKPISLIKIDVQGTEFKVLKGMRNTIKTHKPVIIFEIEDEYFTDPTQEKRRINEWFTELNYALYAIEDNYLYKFNTDTYFHGEIVAVPDMASFS